MCVSKLTIKDFEFDHLPDGEIKDFLEQVYLIADILLHDDLDGIEVIKRNRAIEHLYQLHLSVREG